MNTPPPGLSHVGDMVRRYDRDRFLTALFAPPDRREDLMALYAFNLEIAKTREAVSEPLIGMMRLQWWRDAIAEIYDTGAPRRHAVTQPLAEAIARHGLARDAFDRLIDSRERDLEDTGFMSLDKLEDYAVATNLPLLQLGLAVLGVDPHPVSDCARGIGAGYALAGLMRALPHLLRKRHLVLPEDIAQRHGVDRGALLDLKPTPGLAEAVAEICQRARSRLEEGRSAWSGPAGPAMAVLLQAALAQSHLRNLRRAGYDPFHPRLARRPALLAAELWLRATFKRY